MVAIDIFAKFLLSFLALWLTPGFALIFRRRKSDLRIAHSKSIINVLIIITIRNIFLKVIGDFLDGIVRGTEE